MLCATVEEFERQEERDRRKRGQDLAMKGLTPEQIAARLGVPLYLAQSWCTLARMRP